MTDKKGVPYTDLLEKKWWIDNFLKQNFDFIRPRVSHKVSHRRSDLFIIIDGPVGCLAGDTLVKTEKGYQKLCDLSLKTTYLLSHDFETDKDILGKGVVTPSGNKEIFEIETEDGRKIKATAEHKFFVKRNEKIIELELKDIKEGDDLVCQD